MQRVKWLFLLAYGAGASPGEREDLSRDLACDLASPSWKQFHAAYETAARATASEDVQERFSAMSALAWQMLEVTANVTNVLSCNVGAIAGYYILARLASPLAVDAMGFAGGAPEGEAGLAYRLLQLALVFIFTLRNANRVPPGPGRAWGVSEQAIIPVIMQMRRGQDQMARRELHSLVPIAPSFRDPELRIAVVSICAYPPDHPLALPKVTPDNRERYTNRHGYAARVHMEPPIIGADGLAVQHAKLATVLAYLQSNEFDWVAWFDCDSIIMNMERTLDSVVYQYAQKRPVQEARADQQSFEPVCGEVVDEPGWNPSGEWLDSWIPQEHRDSAVIRLGVEPGGSVQAVAPQFGGAEGRVEDDDLVLQFPDGELRGHLQRDKDGISEQLEWENGAVWIRKTRPLTEAVAQCREPCREPSEGCRAEDLLDPNIDLLITEEGWGLSSANWLIRRSAWSMDFLHNALTAAHVEMNLFGDQDAMILHLMNRQALEVAANPPLEQEEWERRAAADPIDSHAVVVPQCELNAYDALNALTMDCDTFVEGDLLITFPQCKDAEGCNDVFELAADYGKDEEKDLEKDAGAWWRRREGAPTWPRYDPRSGTSLRVFGPRPAVREVFLREQQMRRGASGDTD